MLPQDHLTLWCCITALVTYIHLGDGVVSERMVQSPHCVQSVLSQDYRYQEFGVRSLLECVTRCRPDGNCQAIIFDADSLLCHLGNATSSEDCSNMETSSGQNVRFYEKVQSESSPQTPTETTPQTYATDASTAFTQVSTDPCQNGGVLDGSGVCVCANSFTGALCETVMADCSEGNASGLFTTHGVYFIQPTLSPAPFRVYCQVGDKARTYVLHRDDPTFTFNRTMNDFRHGFGDVNGNFWLGLDKLYQLTNSKTYDLRIRVKPNNTAYYSFFEDFVLNDQTSGYMFTVGTYISNNLVDCLTDLQGASFSTYDADSDGNAGSNCAALFGAGWWYKGSNCSLCNILGPVLSPLAEGRQGVLSEMFWPGFGLVYPFPLTVFLVV